MPSPRIPTAWPASSAKRGCSRRSTIRTSARSTGSKRATASARWSWNWSKARRSPIALAKGALPLDQALRIAIQIASALDTAHRAGIVHRDLKPGNIMLTRSGGASAAPMAKLLDFGLAKASAPAVAGADRSMRPTSPPSLTAPGTILGTCQYMAPEQLEGREADARTDIFAFGAVLYEMLTGKKAFEGNEPRERERRDHVGGPDAHLRAATAHAAGARSRRRHLPGEGS